MVSLSHLLRRSFFQSPAPSAMERTHARTSARAHTPTHKGYGSLRVLLRFKEMVAGSLNLFEAFFWPSHQKCSGFPVSSGGR